MTEVTETVHLFKYVSDWSGMEKKAQSIKIAESHLKSLGLTGRTATKIINSGLKQMSDGSYRMSVKFKDSANVIHNSLQQVELDTKKGLVATKSLGNSMGVLSTKVKKTSTAMKSGTSRSLDFTKALKRVAIVVPLWSAYRAVMMQVNSAIREGLGYAISYDKAMRRAVTVTSGASDMDEFTNQLKKQSEALSDLTGENIGDVIEGYYQFATAGASAEEALAGQSIAMKTSVATMGDLKQTSQAIRLLYDKFGASIDKVNGAQNKMNYIGSVLNTLFKSNRFEMNQFNESIVNGASIGETLNLTFEETVGTLAVLNTAGAGAGKAGTALTQILVKLADNGAKLKTNFKDIFGDIDLKNRDIFGEMITLIEYINSGDSTTKLTNLLGEGIVTLKGIKNVGSLSSQLEKLKQTIIELNNTKADASMSQLNKDFEYQNKRLEASAKRIKIAKAKLGEAFITGVTGVNDLDKAMQNVLATLTDMKPIINGVGKALKFAFDDLNIVSQMRKMEELKTDIGNKKTDFSKQMIASLDGNQEELKKNIELLERYLNPNNFLYDKKIKRKTKDGNGSIITTQNTEGRRYGKKVDAVMDAKSFQDALKASLKADEDGVVLNRTKILDSEKLKVLEEEKLKISKEKAEVDKKTLENVEVLKQYTKEDYQNLENLTILGYTQIDIAKIKLTMLKESQVSKEDELAIEEQILSIKKLQNAEISKSSQALQGQVSSGLSDVIQGNQSIGDFGSNLGDFYNKSSADATAKGITSTLFKNTGIGNIFGEQMQGLESMFNTPMESATDANIANRDENTEKLLSALTGVGGAGTNIASSISSAFTGKSRGSNSEGGILSEFLNGTAFKSQGLIYDSTVDGITSGEITSTSGIGGLFNKVGGAIGNATSAVGGILGAVGKVMPYVQLASALEQRSGRFESGYTTTGGVTYGENKNSVYQFAGIQLAPDRREGYTRDEQGAVVANFYSDPMGLQGAMGIDSRTSNSMLYGPFSKFIDDLPNTDGEVILDEQMVSETKNVATQVQSVQREVGWVNRNLIDLKQTLVYIMQESSYFSENSGIVENFAINASRGR